MHLYSIVLSKAQNDVGNGITLRDDFHHLLDNEFLVLVPANNDFMVQFLKPPLDYENHHHARVNLHDRVRNQFLYARFAYNIIRLSRENLSVAMMKSVSLPDWAASMSPPPSHSSAPNTDEPDQGTVTPRPLTRARTHFVGSIPLTSPGGAISSAQLTSRLFYETFPHLGTSSHPCKLKHTDDVPPAEEVEYSTNHDWHQTSWHPESHHFDELRARYMQEHPQVSQVSGASDAEIGEWSLMGESVCNADVAKRSWRRQSLFRGRWRSSQRRGTCGRVKSPGRQGRRGSCLRWRWCPNSQTLSTSISM